MESAMPNIIHTLCEALHGPCIGENIERFLEILDVGGAAREHGQQAGEDVVVRLFRGALQLTKELLDASVDYYSVGSHVGLASVR